PLMNMAAPDRTARLDSVPPNFRPLIEDRLQQWDKLPPGLQQELLTNEPAIRYFTELRIGSLGYQLLLHQNLTPERRKMLEEGIAQLQAMPEEQRQKLMERFNGFFGLTNLEKQKALNNLSEPERQQIEKTLSTYGRL